MSFLNLTVLFCFNYMTAEDSLPQRLLTSRELEVAILIAKDLKYHEVAKALNLKYETVKTYSNRIRRKLGLTSKLAIALWARKHGLVQD